MSAESSSISTRARHQDQEQIGAGDNCHPPAGFEAIAKAAEGSFAEIWKIQETRTGKPYALKRLHARWQNDPTARRLLKNEVQVATTLNSRHVVRVVRHDACAESPYIVLEWLDGLTLEQQLAECSQLPVGLSLWLARQTAQGLADLFEAGFAHGDVKPSNIFVAPDGEAKLIDLGFARAIDPRDKPLDKPALTGTAEYMAPEMLCAGTWSPVGKDIYSLGVTLFRMLTGRLPFQADTAAEVLRLHREAKPPLLRRWCPQAPRELANLVNRMLAKQPIRRPSSLGGLIHELIGIELQTFPKRCRHDRVESPLRASGGRQPSGVLGRKPTSTYSNE